MNAFSKSFNNYVCVGDTITADANGITYTAKIVYDQESHIAMKINKGNYLWFYCGVVLSASKSGIELTNDAASLWRIEANYPGSDNSFLSEVANELLPEAILAAEKALEYIKAKLSI